MERNGSCSKHESGMHGLFFPFSCTLFLSQSSFSRIHARITLAVRASSTPFPESDDEVTVVGLFERLLKSEHARAEAEHARAEAGSTTYERLLKSEHERAEAEMQLMRSRLMDTRGRLHCRGLAGELLNTHKPMIMSHNVWGHKLT